MRVGSFLYFKEERTIMKKILALAAAAALSAGVSAAAANPFSDVSTSDWAYQAVSALSDQGIVEGYPDGTFRGTTNITRYEMAQIVARLMAREDQYNAEQRAIIDRLAGEYADELDSLGVRVSNLEKKVGNISWSGDTRLQYQDHGYYGEDSWGARLRLNMSAQVNDYVTVEGRFVTELDLKGNDAYTDDETTKMDRLHVVYTPSETFSIDLGRMGVGLSQTGIFMDEDGYFDGVALRYSTEKFYANAGFGRFDGGVDGLYDLHDYDAWFVNAGANISDVVDLNAFFLQYNSDTKMSQAGFGAYADDVTVWGVGLAVPVGNSGFVIDGDYIKHDDRVSDDGALWTAGVTYGEVDLEKPGSFTVSLHYADLDQGAYIGGNSAWDMTDQLEDTLLKGGSFWVAKAGVALARNVELDAYYYFGGDADVRGAEDPDDTFGVELNYFF